MCLWVCCANVTANQPFESPGRRSSNRPGSQAASHPIAFWLDTFRIVNLLTLHSMDFSRNNTTQQQQQKPAKRLYTELAGMHWMHFHCYWFHLLLFALYCCCVYFIAAAICQFIHIPKWKRKKLAYKQTVTQNSGGTCVGENQFISIACIVNLCR